MRSVPMALILGLLTVMPAFAQTQTSALANYEADAKALIEPYIKADRFSGTVLVAKDGKVLFQQAYGLANREWNIANTLDTKFRLGSITKQFTATAIMQLVEQGKLKLDDPISKYYADAPAGWAKVTIQHLLTHTSGIPSYTAIPNFFATQAFNDLTPEGIIKLTRDKPLEFEPGSQYVYDNSGYILLGYVIEKISGQSYEAYVQQHIFEPLGMRNSGYDSSTRIIMNRASGYQPEGRNWLNATYLSMTLPYAAGSLYSTVGDLLIWDQALYANKPANADSLKQAFTDYGHKYGFGWAIDKVGSHDRISHGGGINGFHTFITRYPQDRLTVIALSNYVNGAAERLESELTGLYFYSMGAKPAQVTLPQARLEAYAGKYQPATGAVFTVARQGSDLTLETQFPPHRMVAKNDNEFILWPLDSQVTFNRDTSGNVTGLVLRQNGQDIPAKRVSQAEVDARAAALAERIKNNTQSPDTEPALRRFIAGAQKNQPIYDEMSPGLAAAVRAQSAATQPLVQGWGALKTITFKGVGPAGADIYEVQFENAKVECRIPPLVDGKIIGLNFRPLP